MKINEALHGLMKQKGFTQTQMGEFLKISGGQRVISRKLKTENWQTDSVIEFLDILGYELVIKPKSRGKRSESEILIESSKKGEKEE